MIYFSQLKIHNLITKAKITLNPLTKHTVPCPFRNYHVFYYLLVGASEQERKEFKLLQPEDYLYLKQVLYCTVHTLTVHSPCKKEPHPH